MAERQAGTRRTRSSRRPDTANANSTVSSSISGISTHSQDGDRIENPANTGCRIHGDFSAPMVSEAGTAGDSPAAITRISSGVIAAVARQPRASTTTAAGPAQPRGGTGGGQPPREQGGDK